MKLDETPYLPPIDGRELIQGRSGGQILTLDSSGNPSDTQDEILIAAWQSPIRGVPYRCCIRVDGTLTDPKDVNDSIGMPCAVIEVQYSVGGYSNRKVLVDAVNQDALVVWAESVEVIAKWDRDRIDALNSWGPTIETRNITLPCKNQFVAAAISVLGDQAGEADARYLQVIPWDNKSAGPTDYAFEIPEGARGVRLLNTSDSTNALVDITTQLTGVAWGNDKDAIIAMTRDDPAQACAYDIPAGVKYMYLTFTQDAGPTVLISPFWIEWILSPKSI